MTHLTKRSKIVVQKTMNFWERLYIPAILGGLLVTIRHLFGKKTTIQFPDEKRKFSPVYRGLHVLKRDESGAERCTACGLCALACPAEAITMDAAERKSGEENLYSEEKYASRYEINLLRCIFCGFCEEACPKQAIFLQGEMALADFFRGNFVYGKARLLEPVKRIENKSEKLKTPHITL